MDATTEQTTGSEAVGDDSTSESKTKTEAKKLEFTQEELDKKFADRATQAEKVTAKKFQKQIDDLTAQIEEFKGKDLGELDKLKNKLEKVTQTLAEKDTELTGTNLKLAKITALIKAKADPDQIDDLADMISGNTPEEIDAKVQKFVSLGWIGKQPEPKTEPKNQGTGTQVTTAPSTGKKTLVEQQKEFDRLSLDMKLTPQERIEAAKASLKIANRIMRGETG